jgi:hypothetical protein
MGAIISYGVIYTIWTFCQMERKRLTAAQIRAARALLRWSAADLAEASAVGANTIRRAETTEGATALTNANDSALRRTFEDAGVNFIDENGGGAGVRLRKRGKGRAGE